MCVATKKSTNERCNTLNGREPHVRHPRVDGEAHTIRVEWSGSGDVWVLLVGAARTIRVEWNGFGMMYGCCWWGWF